MPLLLGFLNPQACSCPRAFALPALSAHNCLSPRRPTDSQLTRLPGLEPVVCQVCTEMYPEQERQAVTGESPHGSKKHLGYMPYATWRLLDPHFVSAFGLLLRRRDYPAGHRMDRPHGPVVFKAQTRFRNWHLPVSDHGVWFPREPFSSPVRGCVCGRASSPGWGSSASRAPGVRGHGQIPHLLLFRQREIAARKASGFCLFLTISFCL